MTREDLVFATCNQLAGAIKGDWEDGRPEEVDRALEFLFQIDEPDSTDHHRCRLVSFKLATDYFKCLDPEGVARVMTLLIKADATSEAGKAYQMVTLKLCVEALKLVLINADGWKSTEADNLKKELIQRVKDYEYKINELTEPLLDLGNLELHA